MISPNICRHSDRLVSQTAGDVSSQLANLRLRILALADQDLYEAAYREAVLVVLRGAASNLKDLNRGLEARELSRSDAAALLDEAEQSLLVARSVGRLRARGHTPPIKAQPRSRARRWLFSGIALLVCTLAVAVAIRHGPALAPMLGISAGAVIWLISARVDRLRQLAFRDRYMRVVERDRHVRALEQRSRSEALILEIFSLGRELERVRPEVMRLFDEADDCSPCMPGR